MICSRWFNAALLGLLVACAQAAATPKNEVYDAQCAVCHQAGGRGAPGQFPRLAGRVSKMASAPASRTYLLQAVLHGVAGRIEVDGIMIIGVMPGFAILTDEQVANVLNYLVRLDAPGKKVTSFSSSEVAEVRSSGTLSASAVLAARRAAAEQGLIP